ncbi:hypothetical protein [Rhizobium leguminosarum]|uniref:hypothetical protein n=1 Tax=Rhizobium leguminosarum TaxID=384 RepID=UPI001C96EB3F|nr:hypothetical protein [Rhizobium leguminosarum]MBY5812324.1 hypothetical protein [Rhizobium leguminosarum]
MQTQFTDAERFFAWISRSRQLRKDPEATINSAKAILYPAFIIDPRQTHLPALHELSDGL